MRRRLMADNDEAVLDESTPGETPGDSSPDLGASAEAQDAVQETLIEVWAVLRTASWSKVSRRCRSALGWHAVLTITGKGNRIGSQRISPSWMQNARTVSETGDDETISLHQRSRPTAWGAR